MSRSDAPNSQLVRQPVRLKVVYRDQCLMDQMFQHSPIRIGRLLENDVVLPFDFVSRFHCELRFVEGAWVATDLGSKNGLLVNATERATEIKISGAGHFLIQDLEITVEMETEEHHDFTAIREAKTVLDKTTPSFPSPSPQTMAPDPGPLRALDSIAPPMREHRYVDHAGDEDAPEPLLALDLHPIFFEPHTLVRFGNTPRKNLAIQMLVMWHDQLLEAKEVPLGEAILLDYLGETWDLGAVRSKQTKIELPKGCSPLSMTPGTDSKTLVVLPDTPGVFQAASGLRVSFRYVPRSPELPGHVNLVEEKLVNPLVFSSVVHGTAAITALMISPKHAPPAEEPERFATLIIAPTPPPQQVALQPTPTPTPLMATPTPTPPEIAKEEKKVPPKKVEPPKVKKIAAEKKVRKVAVAKREDPVQKPVEKPVVKQKETVVAVVKEPPLQLDPAPAPPAPAPTPVFEAKKVGALKMLSMLNAGPASHVANVEKIQINRVPASVDGPVMGRQAISGTGSIESKLNQSATGGGTGRGDGVVGVAVGGKTAGGAYQTAGLTGKAGKRKVLGTVLGGATYTELRKSEGLTREQVMKVVQSHQSEIQACYERSLLSNPDLVGRAEFEWQITAGGDVTMVRTKEATIRNGESLLDCVKGVFARMKFPSSKNGEPTTPTIGLPFGRL